MKYEFCPVCNERLVTVTKSYPLTTRYIECPITSSHPSGWSTHFYQSEDLNSISIKTSKYYITISFKENYTRIINMDSSPVVLIKKAFNFITEKELMEQVHFYLLFS
jgi:hypothetical protein